MAPLNRQIKQRLISYIRAMGKQKAISSKAMKMRTIRFLQGNVNICIGESNDFPRKSIRRQAQRLDKIRQIFWKANSSRWNLQQFHPRLSQGSLMVGISL